MARAFRQGVFVPKHPEKYIGDVTKIYFRSSWEKTTFEFLDNNVMVRRWGSEEIKIPYLDTVSNKMRTYFPDIWVEYVTKYGEVVTEIWEIKPKNQTRTPNPRHKHYLTESLTFETNKCKWAAAQAFCDSQGWKFRIVTETSIYR